MAQTRKNMLYLSNIINLSNSVKYLTSHITSFEALKCTCQPCLKFSNFCQRWIIYEFQVIYPSQHLFGQVKVHSRILSCISKQSSLNLKITAVIFSFPFLRFFQKYILRPYTFFYFQTVIMFQKIYDVL